MEKKYKIHYSGFAYVRAENIEEAEDNFDQDLVVYDERGIDSVEEVDEFEVSL